MIYFGFLVSAVAVREARKELGGADWTALVNASMTLSPQRRKVGIVFQDYALFPHLTASQNIQLPLRHLPQPQRREQADQWLRSEEHTSELQSR